MWRRWDASENEEFPTNMLLFVTVHGLFNIKLFTFGFNGHQKLRIQTADHILWGYLLLEEFQGHVLVIYREAATSNMSNYATEEGIYELDRFSRRNSLIFDLVKRTERKSTGCRAFITEKLIRNREYAIGERIIF